MIATLFNAFVGGLTGFGMVILSIFGASSIPALEQIVRSAPSVVENAASATSSTPSAVPVSTVNLAANGAHAYTQTGLLALAGDEYASADVPLGDYRYVTDAPKKGSIYLCNVHKDNPGSMVSGPWIHGTTWNFKQKVTVGGAIAWPNASFSASIAGAYRTLTGNDLPLGETTGAFPVAAADDAHQYDANPNTITAQSLKANLPASPVYAATPYCMGGEAGIMTNGVALFNGFDAGLRDAAAHEVQDSNDGHPQGSGEYHYHSLPAFWHDATVSTVIGFAYDGFPITGPVVANGKYLTTAALDECHGLTSTVTLDGKPVTTYHYVMTYDFPYSASCFRGKPVTTGPSGGPQKGSSSSPSPGTPQTSQNAPPQGGAPPREALSACNGKSSGAACSFTGGRGETVSGTCQTPPSSSLACVPH